MNYVTSQVLIPPNPYQKAKGHGSHTEGLMGRPGSEPCQFVHSLLRSVAASSTNRARLHPGESTQALGSRGQVCTLCLLFHFLLPQNHQQALSQHNNRVQITGRCGFGLHFFSWLSCASSPTPPKFWCWGGHVHSLHSYFRNSSLKIAFTLRLPLCPFERESAQRAAWEPRVF